MNSIAIQVVFRRATSKSLALVLLWGVFFALAAPAQDKLVFAFDIIRHGDRTPLSNPFREAPSVWPEGAGMLTALGTNQEYALGAEVKRLYYRELLDSNAASNSICAFSTDTDRTRMSARLFLSGLVGDAAAQSIPISLKVPINITAGLSDSNAISTGAILNPEGNAMMQALQSQYVFQSPEWKATNAALQPQFARWSQALGVNISSLQDLEGLSDTLYIHQIHHVPLTNSLSPADIDAIIAAGRWAFVYQYNTNIGRVSGKALLKKISEYMENARRDEVSRKAAALKYVLFSAHDSTLLTEMSALRSPLTGTNSPPYGALLHFGLFEAGRTNFYMRVTYKDRAEHVVPDPENGGATWSLEHLSNLAGP